MTAPLTGAVIFLGAAGAEVFGEGVDMGHSFVQNPVRTVQVAGMTDRW